MDTPNITSQEKIAAGLASFLFFIPLLMNIKTPFVVKYMKQGFILNVTSLFLALVLSFIWISTLGGLVNLVLFLTSLFLAIQAFNGKDFVIVFLYENAEKFIQALGISNIFTPGK